MPPALLTRDVNAFSGSMAPVDCLPLKRSSDSGLRESQLALTLTALRHDHPMIAAMDPAKQQLLCERSFPVGSLAFDGLPASRLVVASSSPDHFPSDFEAKRSCLPYGIYYDTDDMIDLEDSVLSHSPTGLEFEDWIMDDLSAPVIGDEGCWLGDREHLKQTKDCGPTLAQLNLTDNFDVEELLSSSPTFITEAVRASKISRPSESSANHQPLMPTKAASQHPKERVACLRADVTVDKSRDVQVSGSRIHSEAKAALTPSQQARHEQPSPEQPQQQQQPKQQQKRHQEPRFVNSSSDQQALLASDRRESSADEANHHPYPIPPARVLSIPQQEQQQQQQPASDLDSGRTTGESHETPGAAQAVSGDATSVKDGVIAKNTTVKSGGESSGGSGAQGGGSPCKSQSPRARNSSLCTEGSVSSHDEGFASQVEEEESDEEEEVEDSDDESFYGDYDAKDLLGATTSDDSSNRWALNMGRARKGGQQRFFWQYNVQSKGPKGTRAVSSACLETEPTDPHVLAEAKDPVFSPECRVEGVKHAGKARRGDGNDLTPNPKKLLMIGLELKKLSKTINDLTPVAEVPVTARNKTRKEKNKLASRACRLKKKAQHEANKIKLFGLQQQHRKTMLILKEIRRLVRQSLDSRSPAAASDSRFSRCVDQAIAHQGDVPLVAGRTSDFVNSVSRS